MSRVTSNPSFVSLRDVAADLGVSRRTIRRLLHDAGVRAILLSSSRNASVRYRRADVDAWLDQRREGSRQ